MESIQCVLDGPTIVPLNVLSDLGRKSLRVVLTDDTIDIGPIALQELWQKLLNTASSSAAADKHLTAACNAVCVFLRYSCRSGHDHVKSFGESEMVWFNAFEVVHKAFSNGKNKPGLQVLETLIQILHENPSRQVSEFILLRTVSEMMEIVFVGDPVVRVKEACNILSWFLRKTQDILPLDRYSEAIEPLLNTVFPRRCKESGLHDEQLRSFPNSWLSSLLLTLLITASVAETNSAAIKLFSILCSKAENVDFSHNVGIASSVIEVFLNSKQEALKDFTVGVFPAVLNDKSQFHKFLNQFDPARDFSDSRLSLFLAILRVGRQKGFVDESDLPATIDNAFDVRFNAAGLKRKEYTGFQYILKCDMPTLRLQAYDLLTASNSPRTPMPLDALRCLSRSFKYLHDDTDSRYRDEYVSITKRFAKRIEQSYSTGQKQQCQVPGFDRDLSQEYKIFLQNWNSFLSLEISPQASYPRHILGLQVLHLTIPLSYSLEGELVTKNLLTSLICGLSNLIFDAFDDVRLEATNLLMKIASHEGKLVLSVVNRLCLVDRAQRMSANTNRADHADALGRLVMLDNFLTAVARGSQNIDRSTATLEALAESIRLYVYSISSLKPTSKYALHGNILGLKYMIHQSVSQCAQLNASVVDGLLQICTKIWALVQSDLCVDSPETSNDEEEQDDLGGPKDLLAYAWRALRDSSLLMQSLLETQPETLSLYKEIGELSFEQLTRLRHRGAFSTVAQTFYLCCQRSRSAESEMCHQLNKSWLEIAFQEISDQSHKLTRRSAGLPSMFAALLDPTDSAQFLLCIQRFDQIARLPPTQTQELDDNEVRLPQVHALNCLKDIMMNARFRSITESLVVQMLNLAAQCIASNVWAIRNCGLMLFRASISRLTPDSSEVYDTQAARLEYIGLKTPLTVAMNLLASGKSDINSAKTLADDRSERSELVFAALDLLGRIPLHSETRQAIDELITSQFASKLWAVREHAGRLRASRIVGEDDVHTMRILLAIDEHMSPNEVQGRVLCGLHIYRNCQAKLDAVEIQTRSEVISTMIDDIVYSSGPAYSHPLVRAACLDLINDVFISSLRKGADCSRISASSRHLTVTSADSYNTRDFFLLHRAIELNRICAWICRLNTAEGISTVNDESQKFASDIANDRDIALYVIDILSEHLREISTIFVLRILVQIALMSTSSTVQALAMNGISQFSSSALSRLTDLEVQKLLSALDLRQAEDRDAWNSQIGLAASLLQLCIGCNLLLDRSLWKAFMDALRVSQQDEVEAPTRIQAVQAAATVTTHVFYPDRTADFRTEDVRLLMVLYDFLNDDDGEVREIATKAVCGTFQGYQDLPLTIIGCAAAARNTIANFVSSKYTTLPSLTAIVYSKIIGAKPFTGTSEVRNLIDFCQASSVANLVNALLQSANDLFAEERQNLYVDDIAEVETWSAVIRQAGSDALPENAVHALSSWTIQGLETLEALLQRDLTKADMQSSAVNHQQDNFIHPLGSTYSSEILIVYVRVVTVAGLLQLHFRRSEAQTKSVTDFRNTMDFSLRSLQRACHACTGHEHVLRALNLAVRDW